MSLLYVSSRRLVSLFSLAWLDPFLNTKPAAAANANSVKGSTAVPLGVLTLPSAGQTRQRLPPLEGLVIPFHRFSTHHSCVDAFGELDC